MQKKVKLSKIAIASSTATLGASLTARITCGKIDVKGVYNGEEKN